MLFNFHFLTLLYTIHLSKDVRCFDNKNEQYTRNDYNFGIYCTPFSFHSYVETLHNRPIIICYFALPWNEAGTH